MYLWLAILSMLSYALQTVLMARYYRQFDPLTTTAARGLSLGLSMLPLLLFAKPGTIQLLLTHWEYLLGAAALAALGNWSAAKSFRYLSVGIAAASQQGMLVISVTVMGLIVFDEVLNLAQWVGIALVIFGNALTIPRGSLAGQRRESGVLFGIVLCCCFGAFLGVAVSLVAVIAREVDPFLAAYSWELCIGILCSLIVLGRARFTFSRIPRIGWRTFRGILLCASPTVIGSGGYALAVTMGPIALIAAVGSTLVITVSVISFFVHGERLTRRQMAAIGVVVCAMVVVRISDDLTRWVGF